MNTTTDLLELRDCHSCPVIRAMRATREGKAVGHRYNWADRIARMLTWWQG